MVNLCFFCCLALKIYQSKSLMCIGMEQKTNKLQTILIIKGSKSEYVYIFYLSNEKSTHDG